MAHVNRLGRRHRPLGLSIFYCYCKIDALQQCFFSSLNFGFGCYVFCMLLLIFVAIHCAISKHGLASYQNIPEKPSNLSNLANSDKA